MKSNIDVINIYKLIVFMTSNIDVINIKVDRVYDVEYRRHKRLS